MEGISTHVYKGIKAYWKRRGYKRLNKTSNTKKDPADRVNEEDRNPVRPRRKKRFFRMKLNRRMRIWKKIVGFPKKLLTRLRDAYVNMMLHIANSGLVVGGSATGFGGSVGVDYGYGYGMSNYRTTQLKEYDEKVIVEIYKSLMIAQGQIDDEEMDQLVNNVPGMSSFIRYRDIPSFCRVRDKSSCFNLQQVFAGELERTKTVRSLILNTFEDLEGPILSEIRSQYQHVYAIGPLHEHLRYRLSKENLSTSNNSSSSLWEVDQGCISWLNQKPDKSVVYVSFGSTTNLTTGQLIEIWAGLVQSNKYFLWVVRPDAIMGSGLDSLTSHDELLEATEKRGCIVTWAPQNEVLAHRAVGGFFTHSGWNSTQESIIAGVPMLCWPYYGDQQVNSRFVSEVWRIGLDMKDTCDRTIVKNMINDLMDGRKDQLRRSTDQMSQLARQSISEGGSSYSNLNQLIEDIKAIVR